MLRIWQRTSLGLAGICLASLAFADPTPPGAVPTGTPKAPAAGSLTDDVLRMTRWFTNPAKSRVDVDKVIDAFVKSLGEQKDLDAAKRDEVIKKIAVQRKDAENRAGTLTDALMAMSPDLAAALTALADEKTAVAVESLTKLAASKDPYLAADATYFLARAHMMEDRVEAALPHLQKLSRDLADKSLYGSDVLYLLGATHAHMLQRKEAVAAFEQFLRNYPDAPERLRVGAFRQAEELKALADGKLVDVEERMNFSFRKLRLEDSGDRTRQEQDRIVSMLDKLIKEAEDKECNCNGSGTGRGRGGKGGNSPGAGARNSTAPQGNARVGPGAMRVNTRNAWDVMREKDREKVLAGLKDKYPERYRKLIEQYYKNLQEKEK